MSQEKFDRLSASPWTLLRKTAGSPLQLLEKLWRLLVVLSRYVFPFELHRRLRRLKSLGLIEQIPTPLQRAIGSVDMFRHFIIPAARDYYRAKGLNFAFHTLLRVLDDPASMADPCGLRADRDVIIGHLMQVVHADPIYDLQLLCVIEGGLEELERQLEQMTSGSHPRTESIRAIVEDAEYHSRLLALVKDFKAGKNIQPLLRDNVAENPKLRAVQEIFGSLPGTMAYFCRLPKWRLIPALRHLLTGKLAT